MPLADLPLSVGIPFQLASWVWVPAMVLLALGGLLLPDGRLLSRRWRPVAWFSVASIVALSAALFWLARPRDEAIPFADVDAEWLGLAFLPMVVSVLASVAGLVVRYRRSTGEQRIQLRWIAWGGTLFGLTILRFPIGTEFQQEAGLDIFRTASLVTGTLFVVALYIAITKHRLYDIDIVVAKTVAFTLLVGIIGGLYVAVVYGRVRVARQFRRPDLVQCSGHRHRGRRHRIPSGPAPGSSVGQPIRVRAAVDAI